MCVRCLSYGLAVLIALARLSQADVILYVDADATAEPHDGSSWCQAFLTLHEALPIAQPGTTIRVADGTYWPDVSGLADPREATFPLANGVTIEGGYAGCGAPDPDERDTTAYRTTLSGDIGVALDPNDNCYHVVTGSGTDESTILDGLTIAAGHADDPNETDRHVGGGMLNDAGSPTLIGCSFAGNYAYEGAAVANRNGSQPTLTGCFFRYNVAAWNGGGMANAESHPTLIVCTFADNSAGNGGGMENYASSPELTGCAFVGNEAGWRGGGMANHISSSATLTDCVFVANAALGQGWVDAGGGAMFNLSSSPYLVGCAFADNVAIEDGGAMHNAKYDDWEDRYEPSNPTLIDCTFSSNTANSGGGMINSESSPTLIRCTFFANAATNQLHQFGGGAICNVFLASPILAGCLFEENSAQVYGGALCNLQSMPIMSDCTFVANSAGNSGGLADYDQCDSTAIRCAFTENRARAAGAAVYNFYGEVRLVACSFTRNFAGGTPHVHGGAAVYSTGSSDFALINCSFCGNAVDVPSTHGGAVCTGDAAAMLVNCTFVGNSVGPTSGHGGGLAIRGSATVRDCTFAGNVSGTGGGIYIDSDDPVTVANCIMHGNEASADAQLGDEYATASVTYSCIESGYAGQGNIDADPLFTRDPDDGGDGWGDDPNTHDTDEGANDDYGDLHLLAGSPCIDAGDDTAVPPDVADLDDDADRDERIPVDLDGNPRFVEDPYTPNTGVSDPPLYWRVVDMGACEFQACFGDLDGDDQVGAGDLMNLLDAYGATVGVTYEDGDLDFDGDVDLADLATLLSVYGILCP